MKYYFITGTSRGIGKAITENLLKENSVKVFGLSRTCSINKDNYEHINIDLSETRSLNLFKFPELKDAEEIILINNSGVLGELDKVGNISNESIINALNVNTIAPLILMNKFIGIYQNYTNKRVIINISSGAGRRPVSSWGTYCASKSGLDMFSQVAGEEQKKISETNRINIFSIAPGIVDTKMQEEIRAVKKEKFAEVDKFIQFKKEILLFSPEFVANKLLNFITDISENSLNNKVLIDLRNY